jgi:serine/threonine protein kinase
MPYIEGESLRGRLNREGRLPVPEAVRIIREVTDALAHAHAQGVVHRDIKPDNVLLSGRHALVADFGVAKAVSEATGRDKQTTVGVALGTPAYMAPEQAMADPNVDHRADIYALGALAYELLTGTPPFTGDTAQAVLSAHMVQSPEEITSRRPDLPAALSKPVMRCLAKAPEDRWQTADELLTRLEGISTPSGGVTPTDTLPVQAQRRPVSRRRRILAIAAAAALPVLAGLGWFILRPVRTAAGPAAIHKLAVLPFQNLSSDTAQDPFSEGLQVALIGELARLGSVSVTPRTSVLRYKHTEESIDQIARELNVDAIIEGTVYRPGNRLRIDVDLVEAGTDRHLWTQTFEREATDLLKMQDEVVGAMVDSLKALLPAKTISLRFTHQRESV